jgi:hypothetical protein
VSDVPQTRPFVLPWKDSDDEVVVNVAIGSLRESLLAWLKTERGVRASCQIIGLLYSAARPQSCQCTPAQAGLVPVSRFASNAPANRRDGLTKLGGNP